MNVEAARHLIKNRNMTTHNACKACTSTEKEYKELFKILKVDGFISRKQAKSEGKTRYFTGKPCKHGHIAERYTSVGTCVQCNRDARSTYVNIYVLVHRDDVEMVKDFTAALKTGREITP